MEGPSARQASRTGPTASTRGIALAREVSLGKSCLVRTRTECAMCRIVTSILLKDDSTIPSRNSATLECALKPAEGGVPHKGYNGTCNPKWSKSDPQAGIMIWLIDVVEKRLVPNCLSIEYSYVALNYVLGKSNSGETTKNNIKRRMRRGSLRAEFDTLPAIIQVPCSVVEKLREGRDPDDPLRLWPNYRAGSWLLSTISSRLFAGLVAYMESSQAGPFVAGIPLNNLDRALLWAPTRELKRRVLKPGARRIPSWSRCAWDGQARYTWATFGVLSRLMNCDVMSISPCVTDIFLEDWGFSVATDLKQMIGSFTPHPLGIFVIIVEQIPPADQLPISTIVYRQRNRKEPLPEGDGAHPACWISDKHGKQCGILLDYEKPMKEFFLRRDCWFILHSVHTKLRGKCVPVAVEARGDRLMLHGQYPNHTGGLGELTLYNVRLVKEEEGYMTRVGLAQIEEEAFVNAGWKFKNVVLG
ncbi:hypothetical protein DL762_000844 [Monosporascus cannonballus]|uniref:Heterokaryon incompatibility domain-containing protein n=1 Tax=Monosporascus cannonballus TaxID=155416 RepID=A0ABY0HKD7_9PEZI|nr:hypothetical protein DL762_000844 [Monosporascus cannonballus]